MLLFSRKDRSRLKAFIVDITGVGDLKNAKAEDMNDKSFALTKDKHGNRISSLISDLDIYHGLPPLNYIVIGTLLTVVISLINYSALKFALTIPAWSSLWFVLGGFLVSLFATTTTVFLAPRTFNYFSGFVIAPIAAIIHPLAGVGALLAPVIGSMIEHYRNLERISSTDREMQQSAKKSDAYDITEANKRQQETTDKQDASKNIRFGRGMGFTKKLFNDPLGYSENSPVIINEAECFQHIAVFGSTGKGKTYSILKPISLGWIENRSGGLFLIDGKGSLYDDFEGVPGYIRVSPDHHTLALMEGLNAEEFATIILSVVTDDNGKKDYFSQAGKLFFQHNCLLLEYQAKKDPTLWTVEKLNELIQDDDLKIQYAAEIREDSDARAQEAKASGETYTTTTYDVAVKWMQNVYENMADKQKDGVKGSGEVWLSPLVLNEDILKWSQAHTGIDPTIVMKDDGRGLGVGAILGIDISENEHGDAAALVQKIVKARVYRALRLRKDRREWVEGDGNVPVKVCIDEAQEVLDDNDRKMLAVARSKGCALMISTQSYNSVVTCMDGSREKAGEFMNNFNTVITLRSSSDTFEYIEKDKVGAYSRPLTEFDAYDAYANMDFTDNSALHKSAGTSLFNEVKEAMRDTSRLFNTKDHQLESDVGQKSKVGVISGRGELVRKKVMPAITKEEMQLFTTIPYVAIVVVNRANGIKRDVMACTEGYLFDGDTFINRLKEQDDFDETFEISGLLPAPANTSVDKLSPLHKYMHYFAQNEDLIDETIDYYNEKANVENDRYSPNNFVTAIALGKVDAIAAHLMSMPGNMISELQDNTTALHAAISVNNAELVDLLLKEGADVNVKSNTTRDSQSFGLTPLHEAVLDASTSSEILYSLLNTDGIDINAKETGRDVATAITIAAGQNNLTFVRLLLKFGANPHIKDIHGNDALAYATKFNNKAIQHALSKAISH